ncbi:helix-turn-helix domain-containing protein [Paraburkholderia sp. EG304]|uniref:helix-turn-helix domain-containing protein n=1 Tax=Paraburkholderia sp. EG304 TaxID=3237015 RepID=UPI003978AD5D
MSLDDLPAELLDDISMSGAMPSLRDENASLEATERSAIARALGVSRSTLYRKIEFYRLEGMVKPADRE